MGAEAMAASVTACAPDCSNYYALLISGGYDVNNNAKVYYTDVKSMYDTLTQTYGYPKDHITVLMSDGVNTSKDRCPNPVPGGLCPNPDDSPTATDFPGSTIGDAKLATVTTTLTNLKNTLGTNDNLFIFTTSHGNQTSGTSGKLWLWAGDSITDANFASRLDSELKSINIVMEQCYGGVFIDDLASSTQSRTIATAADYYESSYGNYFSGAWITGVANTIPADGVDGTAKDARASMSEAYTFAKNNDNYATIGKEHPQFKTYNTAGTDKFLSGCFATPTIRVTAPNTIETWYMGTTRTIQLDPDRFIRNCGY